MKYYNFLAKSPGVLLIAGARTRLNAGDTLRLPESKGKLVTEGRANGSEYLLLVSVEGEDKEPDQKPDAKEQTPSATEKQEALDSLEGPERIEEAPPQQQDSKPLVSEGLDLSSIPNKGVKWYVVRAYLNDLEDKAQVTTQILDIIAERFPNYDSIQEQVQELREKL